MEQNERIAVIETKLQTISDELSKMSDRLEKVVELSAMLDLVARDNRKILDEIGTEEYRDNMRYLTRVRSKASRIVMRFWLTLTTLAAGGLVTWLVKQGLLGGEQN